MTATSSTSAPAGLNIDKGTPLKVMPVGEHLSLATLQFGRLATMVPDPRTAEDPKALQYASIADRQQAELRNAVQRMIKSTKKQENAKAYAAYIAKGLRGVNGNGWATPPFALYFQDQLEHQSQDGPFGPDHVAFLPFGLKGVLVDAETQFLAHLLLLENPEIHGITTKQVNERVVGIELYHGILLEDARQIFHDRNLYGVIPNKTVALNSDSRDIATRIANDMMNTIIAQHPQTKVEVKLRNLVSVNKRQLGAKDPEWFTLSTLRSFIIALLFGRPGFELSSAAVNPEDLPVRDNSNQVTEDEAAAETVEIARQIFNTFQRAFSRRTDTVIGSPAVLAAIGAVAHRSTSWSKEPRRTQTELSELLSNVVWDREPKVWDGIAGKVTASGSLSLAGGVKDNGSKTASALEDPMSESYRRIRRTS
ncbi:DGQHR domain [Mycobacteroides abscessus]|uniref:DNA sulfur modification protein DndB n=1 Tax=Mycobacteroides abscessus TaxID=36809 RepID=UPI0005DAAD2E|nr:DNA sulfur modification protein DndB [Mycobacteroides abscessus]CPT20928.1 DGQHR domain [Mycobacteroides abscessus]CPU25072.1 DGQHR domain [Mycobacteroides abscessus]SKI88270.1 DGQHR domain [Mycobacteroides abscessus subsp. massiliense]SKP22636.1 DGQHR domain [Mycobacteroides abscessus subsp. massiliense]SKV09135.1 DGQHR domain [Mycobacteroides abscessus subsp. massiliense]